MSSISTSSKTWEGDPVSRGGSPWLFANKSAYDSDLHSSETLLVFVAKLDIAVSPLPENSQGLGDAWVPGNTV